MSVPMPLHFTTYNKKTRRQQETCYCKALPFPHRLFSVKDCTGEDDYCAHGVHKEDRCKECEYEERADYEFEMVYDR